MDTIRLGVIGYGVRIDMLMDQAADLPVEVKESPVEQELKALDLGNMTPIQALNLLYELQQKCR